MSTAGGEALGNLLGDGAGAVLANLRSTVLVEQALIRREGPLADNGALVVRTGAKTGRSPDDKDIRRSAGTDDVWWGNVNPPVSREGFDSLLAPALPRPRARARL